MPSIAQQDYLRPQGKSKNDCHLLAALAHNIQQGTIFDTAFEMKDGDGDLEVCRVLSYNPGEVSKYIYYCDTLDSEIRSFQIDYTQTQYEGLAAIQDARDDYSGVPMLFLRAGYLAEGSIIDDEITIGGKKIAVTAKDGHLASIAISEVEYNGIEISWEDAQKLIGLPIE